MDLQSAKHAFVDLVNSLENEDRSQFLIWVKERYSSDTECSKGYFDLRTIAEDIKTLVPSDAIFPSEKICHDHILNDPEYNNAPIVHVDSFLFEDEHIDALVEEGKISRNYCKECGSANVAPITFMSHSASVQRIEFIFQYLLPDLSDKVLIDVGSRLGAILYGAYYFSKAKKIIGVEINADFCKLQQLIINKYNLADRIEVLCDNVCNIPTVVQEANVIVLNNVFECFLSKEAQEQTWKWLRQKITNPGTILVTVPSIEDTLKPLTTGIDISKWVKRIPITEEVLEMDDQDLLSEICSYAVI